MCRFLLLTLVYFTTVTAGQVFGQSTEDPASLQRYLERHQLVELQVVHLEHQLELASTPGQTGALGLRLANLYVRQLAKASDDPDKFQDTLRRVQQLIQRVPSANTPALRVTLLQADYARAESKMLQWFEKRFQPALLDQAREILSEVAPQLARYRKELLEQEDALAEEVSGSEISLATDVQDDELNQLRIVRIRATYYCGWAHYYLGVTLNEAGPRKDAFRAAKSAFYDFLGLAEDEDIAKVETDWLGLESPLQSRSLLGLGLVEAGLGEIEACQACFRVLQDPRVPTRLRDESAYWQLQGLLNANQLEAAAAFAQQRVGTLGGKATKGPTSFCVSLVRFGYAGAASGKPNSELLGRLGLEGLARLRQFNILNQLMTQHKITIGSDANFYLLWIKGYQQYSKAESEKDPNGYRQAAETLTRAVSRPRAKQDLHSSGYCRYQLAWSLYQTQQYEPAAQEFQKVKSLLKSTDDTTAVNAAWLKFQSYAKLIADQPRFKVLAIDALNEIKREFPNSRFARRVDYEMTRLQRSSGSTDQVVASLEAIGTNDPNYLSARYELCLLYHQQWNSQRSDPAAASTAARAVLSAVDRFLDRAGDSEQDMQRRLKAALLATDVLLRSEPRNLNRASSYLQSGSGLIDVLTPENPSVVEYYYQKFQIARFRNDAAATRRFANWLVDHGGDSLYKKSALIILAKQADQAVAQAAPSQLTAQRRKARDLYRQLVNSSGNAAESLATNKNARVALSKLAAYEYDLGNYKAAADRLQQLVQAFPKNQGYLRRAGQALFAAKSYVPALEIWRTLLRGVEKNSSTWYEAKYHVILCLLYTDPQEANKVYQQFKRLYPTVEVKPWDQRFRDLDRRFSS